MVWGVLENLAEVCDRRFRVVARLERLEPGFHQRRIIIDGRLRGAARPRTDQEGHHERQCEPAIRVAGLVTVQHQANIPRR